MEGYLDRVESHVVILQLITTFEVELVLRLMEVIRLVILAVLKTILSSERVKMKPFRILEVSGKN